MKISTILLEGDAGSGKTQLAKALSADFKLPYTKVTCFADMDKSDVLGSILPVFSDKDKSNKIEYRYYPSEIVRAYENVLSLLAETIILLDETARANAMKGVAGMRSYIFWVDAVASGASVQSTLYHKVLYKITTDPQELAILGQALVSHGLTDMLDELNTASYSHPDGENPEVMELHISENGEYSAKTDKVDKNAIRLRKSADSRGHSDKSSDKNFDVSSNDSGEMEFRKQLNKEARQSAHGSCHEGIKLIVHRPKATVEDWEEYNSMAATLLPVIRELIRRTNPLLEHEVSAEFAKSQLYGAKFCADQAASLDFRVFARKRPPGEEPSLAVALRIDESASMSAFGRLEAAK